MRITSTLILIGHGLFLTSCVVYMPMQCAAPQITDAKQAEITGSSYLNGRVEVPVLTRPCGTCWCGRLIAT
jgi:hypothetical protein